MFILVFNERLCQSDLSKKQGNSIRLQLKVNKKLQVEILTQNADLTPRPVLENRLT